MSEETWEVSGCADASVKISAQLIVRKDGFLDPFLPMLVESPHGSESTVGFLLQGVGRLERGCKDGARGGRGKDLFRDFVIEDRIIRGV